MMRIPFLKRPPREFAIAPLQPGTGKMLSDLHSEDFIRPWSDGEFELRPVLTDDDFGDALTPELREKAERLRAQSEGTKANS